MTNYLACDLGAESGRVMLGTLDNGKVTLRELHRFPSPARRIQGTLRWDVFQIFEELKTGLRKAGELGLAIDGVSTDSWGVDYVYFSANEPQVGIPYHYRDDRLDGVLDRAFAKLPKEKITERTGIQFMQFNTLFQLFDDLARRPEIVAAADNFLCIADYLNYLMSGVAKIEVSMASTMQMYDPNTRAWATDLLDAIGFPKKLLPEIAPSGSLLGAMSPDLARETNLANVQVIATCSHDTGAAVAAVPAEAGDDWAYLSSGTWSLLGVELPAPIINAKSTAINYTNEIGYGHTVRFLKNIVGFWLMQECRRDWESKGEKCDYDAMVAEAAAAEPFRSIIRPDSPRFAKPGDMPAKIAAYCRETSQPEPQTQAQYVRCIIESLALLYTATIRTLEDVTERSIRKLHIVGGGSRNALLNQATADASGCTVIAGPIEATALGNVLIQALALGHIDSLQTLRNIVRDSFDIKVFTPQPSLQWKEALERFGKLGVGSRLSSD